VYLLGLYRFVIFVNRCRLECWDTLNAIGLDVDTGDVNCTTFNSARQLVRNWLLGKTGQQPNQCGDYKKLESKTVGIHMVC